MTADPTQSVTVLLCGELLRGDDGVAAAAADDLPIETRERAVIRWVGALAAHDLLGLPAGTPCVIVDAVAGPPPGRLLVRSLADLARGTMTSPISGHRIPLPQVLALAERLGWLPRGTFLGLAGERFALGDDLSPSVVEAVPRLRAAIALEVARLARPGDRLAQRRGHRVNVPRGLDLDSAADAIEGWGFLAAGRQLGDPRPGYLLIALRRHPTLDHFDPESIRFWIPDGHRAVRCTLDRTSQLPWEHDLSWGTISVWDRLRVHNDYLTFGGVVSAGHAEDTAVAVFLSPAPLLCAGGHSQGWDPGAQAVGAFFGRLAAAAGSRRELDDRISRADPVTRYAAFVAHELGRAGAGGPVAVNGDRLLELVRQERTRLQRTDPTRWAGGCQLLESLDETLGASAPARDP